MGVEGAEPGLAEAGSEDDEAGGVALRSRLFEGFERLLLDGVGREDRGGLFRHLDRASGLLRFGGRATLAVGVDPGPRELAGGRVAEEAVESRLDLLEGGGVGLRDGTVVPLDAGEERRLAEVGAADEGDARAVRALEDVGLGVEGEGGRRARVVGDEASGSVMPR